jgi:arylsulfatase A-like enzyme
VRARRAAGLLLSALWACGADPGVEPAPPPPAPSRPPNILLVSFDTLRADHLGCYGWDRWGRSISPAVDALAARGALFESCWAPRGQTRPSLASMLSGKYPITTGLRENRLALLEQHRSFFELLAAAGWDTGIFLANFDTGRLGGSWAFRGAATAVSGKLREEQGPVSLLEKQWDDRVEEAALEWLAGRTADRPFAAWVHFFDIHDPYNPPGGFDLYGHSEGLPEELRSPGPQDGEALNAWLAQVTLGAHDPTPAERERVLGLYDGTVTATDARLRRLLETLDATGLRDSTCVIFTSDHGEELGDRHGYWYHDSSVWPGTLRIPLVVAGPGIPAGVRVPAQVQNLDLAATVLELCGLAVPADMESRSLVGLLRGTSREPTRPHAFLEFQDILYAVVGDGHQYVHNPRHAQPRKVPYFRSGRSLPIGCFEGYDLRTDPLARHDLLAGLDPAPLIREENLPEPLRPLRRALMHWLNEPQHEREMSWPGLGVEALPDLMALGYVGGGADREDVLFLEDCQGR